MVNIEEIVSNYLERTVNALKDNLTKNDRVATGKTRDSIKKSVTVNGSKIEGVITSNKALDVIRTGRNPTGGSKTGSSVWFEQLREWVIARNGWFGGVTDEKAINAITHAVFNKIHDKGWEGTPNIIYDVIDENWVDGLNREISRAISDEARNNLSIAIRQLNATNNN